MTRGRGASALLLTAAALALVLSLPPPAHADAFDRALAKIDEALETNPNGVSPESLRSCQAMRRTAVLLHEMGRNTRAFRRLKSCRRLLELEGYRSGSLRDPARRSIRTIIRTIIGRDLGRAIGGDFA
jgi:hypothetical protein